jgi:F-type H+-transporting ATPase subunit c
MFGSLLTLAEGAVGLGPGLGVMGAGIGIGLLVFGAAKGIGNIGGNAVQAVARQPSSAGQIFLQMIISAALIEGFTFFALILASGLAKPFFASAGP